MFEEHEKFLFQNENNVVLNENSVGLKPCINRESNSLELTIQVYSWYNEHEAPRSCNTTVYLSESYPQNDNFDDLPIEYDQSLITEQPIYSLKNNIVDMFKVSLIKLLFDN